MKCPVCKGSGLLPDCNKRGRDLIAEKQKMARVLRNNGYSLRQIRDFIGWKSTRSVVIAIEATK